ncbi:MAG TPA: heme-copper oxidase subunit III [Acidimicrobiales bacterium]|nr:heme-copper oxidase subunit III [Acidimicrobiales bacterium]
MAGDTHELTIAETGVPGEVFPETATGPRSFGWWGMVWLIATEATLFAILLASYFYLRFRTGVEWPPEHIHPPKLELPLIMTAILWSSSYPVHLAEKGIEKGNQRRLKWGLAAGWLLGAIFLFITLAFEWPETLHEFTPRTNAYGSMFFTITGFHASHVVVGLSVSLFTQFRAWQGAFDERRHVSVQNFAMYWHFVDIVWLFVLVSVYLSPHL